MADAHGSGPCVGNNMRVQVPSPAYKKQQSNLLFFYFTGKSCDGKMARYIPYTFQPI